MRTGVFMKKTSFIPFILILSVLASCEKEKSKPSKNQASEEAESKEATAEKLAAADPKQLLDANCVTCHQLQESESNLIAPSISAVRNIYRNETKSRDEFIDAMIGFAKNPAQGKIRLPGAVQKFGMMAVGFPEEKIRKIAGYIYDTEFEKEGFTFYDYRKLVKAVALKDLPYQERGLKYALETKKVLGKNLIGALESKGTEDALTFCNEKALALTQKMATQYGVSIKRVSDKPRNANNAANTAELDYIKKGKAALKKGEKLKPQMLEREGKIVGYYPIKTKQMCMQCHGETEKQIKPSTLLRLKKLYPKDKAINYGVGELRGIWVIAMEKDAAEK